MKPNMKARLKSANKKEQEIANNPETKEDKSVIDKTWKSKENCEASCDATSELDAMSEKSTDEMHSDPLEPIAEVSVKCELIEISDDEILLEPVEERKPEDVRKPGDVKESEDAQREADVPKPETPKKKRKRAPAKPKPVQCEVCAKIFGSKSQLKKHMLIHTGERPYICAECGKSYRQSHHLKTHEMSHMGITRDFTCTECGSSFTRKSSLHVHLKIHTGLKPYACHLCSKSFVQKINLVYHIKVHEGDRKFECEECCKKFMTRSKLKEHSRKHAKKKLKQAMLLNSTGYNSEDDSPTLVSTSPLWGSVREDEDSVISSK